jgi:hypothetical protein
MAELMRITLVTVSLPYHEFLLCSDYVRKLRNS